MYDIIYEWYHIVQPGSGPRPDSDGLERKRRAAGEARRGAAPGAADLHRAGPASTDGPVPVCQSDFRLNKIIVIKGELNCIFF